MTSNNIGYEAIPDVEAGLVTAESGKPSLEEKYPDANDYERAFLGTLDEAMEKAKPEISVPKFKSTDVGPPADPKEFIQLLIFPTIAFGISLGSAIAAAAMASPVVIALFPYYSCIITFAASLIPMKEIFSKRADAIFNNVDRKEKEVLDKVDGISSISLGYVNAAENAMDTAFEPIRPKLDKATKLEKTLQVIDPDIDIPDPSDIEEAFDGFTGQIRGVMDIVTSSVNVAKNLPKPIASKEKLFCYVFLPVVSVFLILQLAAIYASTHNMSVASNAVKNVVRLLEEIDTSDEFATRMTLLKVSVQTYLTTFVQMILVYVAALPAFAIIPMNQFIQDVERDINETLDQYAGPTFNTIFVDGFGSVKEKMLEFVAKMEKIEGPMEQAEKMVKVANLGGMADSMKSTAGEKAGSMKSAAGEKAGAAIDQGKAATKNLGNAMSSKFKKFGF